MFEHLAEIIQKADNGDVESMIAFVKDYEIQKASKLEKDIKERRNNYIEKLVEERIPFAFQELAFEYEEIGNIKKAIDLLEESVKYGNTFSLEHLGKYYFFGEYVKQDLEKAYKFFNEAIDAEKYSDIENVDLCYPFVANLFLGEMYRRGMYVKSDIKKASKYYGDSCWISIQGYEPESDEMVISSYFYGLERLGKIEGGIYKKNVVEALSILELAVDWEFSDEELLSKLGISKFDIQKTYEECKSEIEKIYPNAKYIVVNAGKYVIAKGEKDNQVMEFEDDIEAKEYVADNCDKSNGNDKKSVKFVLNTETWETLYSIKQDVYLDED